jgi:ATP-dependent protease ClpP protease subunit
MSKIELRGVIVPSEYDASWAEGYIQKGIIIPESRFRALLASASKQEPLTVYVNSPGGSVFSAGEMVNAVREWKAETKQPVTVTLGALTASAASAFAIMVADEIKVHANAKMMFHGAWTMSMGGKEMHEDTAELLDKINGDIKSRLVSKYGMNPETVTEWFAEGREGWLDAQDLVSSKLASEIIEDPSDVIEFSTDALGEIENRGLGIAAFLETNTQAEASDDGGQADETEQPSGGDVDAPSASDEPDEGEPSPVEETAADAASESEPEPTADTEPEPVSDQRTDLAQIDPQAIEAARLEGFTQAQEQSGEIILTLRAKLVAEQETARKLQSERDQLRSANDKAVDSLKKANDHIQRLLSGGLSFSVSIEDWGQALSACGGNYEEARRKYPDAYRSQREQDKNSRK